MRKKLKACGTFRDSRDAAAEVAVREAQHRDEMLTAKAAERRVAKAVARAAALLDEGDEGDEDGGGGERAPAAGDGQQLDPDVFNQKLVRRLEGVPREKRLHMLDMLSKMEADLSEAPSPSAAPKN